MKVAVWGWQFRNEYPGEQGAPGDDSQLPIAEYWGKTNDGLNWQGVYDDHPAEFGSILDVTHAEAHIYGQQGIEFKPWGVVRGQQPGWTGTLYAAEEGKRAGQIAVAAAGRGERAVYIIDLEPYYHGGAGNPQFWRNDLGAGPAHVRAFLAAFKAAGGQEIFLAPDARQGHLDPVSFRDWLADPIVTLVMPQVYWTDFKRTPAASLDTAKAELAKYGVAASRIVAVTPGHSTPEDMKAGIAHAHRIGFRGVSVWRRGTISREVYDAIAGIADPWAPKAEEPTPGAPTDKLAEIEALAGELSSAALRLKGTADQIRVKAAAL